MARKITYEDLLRTGPGTLAGGYLRMFWHPIEKAESLPRGRALPVRLLNEQFTLYRGESERPYLVEFRCAHRGTQLSVGRVEGECIRCFFHGWKYDGSGQCVEQPAEREPFAEKVKIRSYPCKEYLGLIFVYLGEGEAPPLPRYSAFEEPEVMVDLQSVEQPYNYYQNLENSVDFSHTGYVHGDRIDFDPLADQPEMKFEETEWGIASYEMLKDGRTKVAHVGMPGVTYVYAFPFDLEIQRLVGRFQLLVWKVPVDDELHRQFYVRRLPLAGEAAREYLDFKEKQLEAARNGANHGELIGAILSGKLRVEEIDRRRIDMAVIQDAVAQAAQGTFHDRSRERLAPSDRGVILMRKIWQRELQLLSEGRSAKSWTRRPEMLPTTW